MSKESEHKKSLNYFDLLKGKNKLLFVFLGQRN